MHVEIVTRLASGVLPQVRALLDVARQRDGVESIGEHKFLRVSSGTNAAGVKAILAYDGERLAGYANVEMFPIQSPTRQASPARTASSCRLSAEMVVHPEARGHGAASAMLAAIINEARSHDLERVDIWAYHQLSGTRELAAKFGFEPSRTLLEIRMRLPESFPEAPLPPGVELRSFRAGQDESEWLALNNLVFESHPEQGAWDDEDLAVRLRQPWFDAQDFLVADKSGRLVAYNWLKLDHAVQKGEIYVIGVHPDERRRHFGRSLTILGLEHMVRRGMKDASAYVDASNSGALAMYYSLGFGLDHSDLCYSKPLKDAQPA
ncbi:MAG TPA: mycothiol synthase [Chloroflexota bacterium]|nr:mycothiol synthase [Chloroflexota bacterium]